MNTIEVVRCSKCRTLRVWRDMVLTRRIERAELALHVVKWPAEVIVEVRRCSCGGDVARLQSFSASAASACA